MIGYSAIQKRRLERRYERVRVCLATADADCAPAAIERLRSAGPDRLRLAIAEADLSLLLSKAGERPALPADGLSSLDPATRADYLLFDGDWLVEAGQFLAARAR